MSQTFFSAEQISELRIELEVISAQCTDIDCGKHNTESDIYQKFALSTISGKKLYQSLPDEYLLAILTNLAKSRGHSPSQKEIFWVYREYIKLRFQKWPYALKKAGLCTAAGKCGKSLDDFVEENNRIRYLLKLVCDKTCELGRLPHQKDMPEISEELKKYFTTWHDVLVAADIDYQSVLYDAVYKIEDLEEKYIGFLQEILKRSFEMGRAPLKSEVADEVRKMLIERCGTWRNALFQVDLEPVIRISPFANSRLANNDEAKQRLHRKTLYDCYYKVLILDEEAKRQLQIVGNIADKLGRAPTRKEVPADIRSNLQTACGSWSNALFQLGLVSPVSRNKNKLIYNSNGYFNNNIGGR